jgi:hypothetical protein
MDGGADDRYRARAIAAARVEFRRAPKIWKSPTSLRLHYISQWRKARFERDYDRVEDDSSRATAYRSATLYMMIERRLDGLAIDGVSTFES